MNSDVSVIDQVNDNIQVTDFNGRRVTAKATIIAISHSLRQRIVFRPETRSFLIRNTIGSMIKVLAIDN